MTIILYPFIFLAAIGLTLSFIVHVSALLGHDLGLGQAVYALHGGIFIVWVPAVLVSFKTQLNFSLRDFWKVALRSCPAWMRKMTYGFFIYGIINFAIFIFYDTEHPAHGSKIPELTILKGFSGHWMAFYSAAFSILYASVKSAGTDPNRRCINGHIVSPAASYCEKCGAKLIG